MSLPKEPRQKMINMMYLVLTALLALNVSAEILNAFKTVNRTLDNANVVLNNNNDIIYTSSQKKRRIRRQQQRPQSGNQKPKGQGPFRGHGYEQNQIRTKRLN